MAGKSKGSNNYGPVLTCGAASVSLSHKAGEPTVFDTFFAAVKKLFNGNRRNANKVEVVAVGTSDRRVESPYGMAS